MSDIHTLPALVALLLASAAIPAGASVFDVPFTDDFGPQNHLSEYVVLDANGDGEKWHLNTTWNIFGGDRSLEEMRISTWNGADDWFITPALHLTAGQVYSIAFDAHRSDYRYAERMEVCLGQEATVEGMSTEVMPPFDLTSDGYETYSKEFVIEETGNYRLGLHALSPVGSSDIFVDNLCIKLAVEPGAPAAVSDLQVSPDASGAHRVTLTFTSPSTTVGGDPLSALTRIDILRNRQVVGSIQHPEVNAPQTYVDKTAPNGMNAYSVVAYNAVGKGMSSDAEPVYVGVDVPQAPAGARIVDNGTSVTISWDPVGPVGSHGLIVDPANVVYSIQEYDFAGDLGNRVYYGSETSATLPLNTYSGNPDMAKWAIMAHSDAGVSELTNVRMAVGSCYRLPYSESFRQGKRQTLIWVEQCAVRYFRPTTEDCADGDGGSIIYRPYEDNDSCTCCLGRIALRGAANPMLTFSYKAAAGSTIEVLAWTADGNESILARFEGEAQTEANGQEWRTAKVALASYLAQPYVVLKFRAWGKSEDAILLDNLRVGDLYPIDLDLWLEAPEVVSADEELTVNVRIANVGDETVDSYLVQLTAIGGEDVFETDCSCHDALASLTTRTHAFALPASVMHADRLLLRATVSTTGDLGTANNAMSAIVGIEGNEASLHLLQGGDKPFDIYTPDGRLMRRGANGFDGLHPGTYIIKQ